MEVILTNVTFTLIFLPPIFFLSRPSSIFWIEFFLNWKIELIAFPFLVQTFQGFLIAPFYMDLTMLHFPLTLLLEHSLHFCVWETRKEYFALKYSENNTHLCSSSELP